MIQGKLLQDAVISASNTLSAQKQAVDELNVFPVPDGDTGTNMSMTISAARRELERLSDPTVTEVADVTASAMLRGARGNSGVILSLLFRGFSKGLKGKAEASGADLAEALSLGVAAAYKAVMKPTEGTILTVAREAAEKGCAFAKEQPDADFSAVWDVICEEAAASLARTPDLLPTLKKAGVVDAGGKGFLVIAEAMQNVFHGGAVAAGEETAEKTETGSVSAAGSFDTEITFTYCTEFIVERNKNEDQDPLRLRAYLESIGDCVVVVDDEEIIKVHVHTNDPGKALSEGVKYGQFETVKVENMRIQHQNAGWAGEEAQSSSAPARVEPEEEYGFVAIAAGEGLTAMFHDLGAAQVVSGGQTMNPSTDDILSAIEATPAKVVYVLPNNKNIILAAEQTIPLADRKVHVLPTRTIPQGIAAMLAFDSDASVEDNLMGMMRAADNAYTGQLTYAARDSEFAGHHIKEGQILVLENGKVTFAGEDMTHCALKMTRSLLAARRSAGLDTSFITIFYGENVTDEEAQTLCAAVQAKAGDSVEVTALPGGQPVYYYIFSLE